MKKLLEVMRPKRLYVISNTSAEQYRQEGTLLKHYSVMPESFDDTNIEPESYVIIDDIRVLALKCGSQASVFTSSLPCIVQNLRKIFDGRVCLIQRHARAVPDCLTSFRFT